MEKKLFENETLIPMPICVCDEVKNKIEHWKATNVFFGVFPVTGNSMTCNDNLKSIPHNSKVLAYDLEIDCSKLLDVIWHQIPVNETLLIMGKTIKGKDFFVCKSISNINAVSNCITLHSYNPEFHNQTIPFDWVNNIFKVIQRIE
mgnify:CR=1 FL=1